MVARIDIFVRARNAERFLPDALASLQAQTFQDFRVRFLDEGGNGNFPARMDPDAIESAPHGMGVAYSKLMAIPSDAEYICQFDADDRLTPDALAMLIRAADEHPSFEGVISGHRLIDENGDRMGPDIHPPHTRSLLVDSMLNRYSIHGVPFFKRIFVEQVGGWDAKCKFGATYDLYLRLLNSGAQFAIVDDVTLEWRQHPDQVSRKHTKELHAAITSARATSF